MHMMGAAAGDRSVASGHVSPVPFCRSGSHVLFLACHASTGAEAGNSSEKEDDKKEVRELINSKPIKHFKLLYNAWNPFQV